MVTDVDIRRDKQNLDALIDRFIQRIDDSEAVARLFHETYERLAPEYGYTTRPVSAVAWEDVPENNRRLMIATCAVVGDYIKDNEVKDV